jgi:4-amino-4-deoxy-L-arabinose transferase-like glycosyltransferase
MESSQPSATPEARRRLADLLPVFLVVAGLLVRLAWAYSAFLNPDEALHYLLSVQPSLALTYKAALTTAHPPLLIVLLHYWSLLGNSEFFLRIPSVLAGTAFCWVTFLWLDRAADRTTACIALSLLLFSPGLIYLSAEIRQYSLLLFFTAGSLYCLDRAIAENSPRLMLLSAMALYLALLTHYSSFIFALTIGIYALVRFWSSRTRPRVIGVWGVTQLGALGLGVFLLRSHALKIKAGGMSRQLADSYLRGSIFHVGEDRIVPFVLRANVRLFHYLFSQGAVGILGLLLFIAGIALLLADKRPPQNAGWPTSRQLGLLFVLPLVTNCVMAFAGLYPYGGTRHNSYLAGFAMSGVAVALARWKITPNWIKPVAIAVALAVCNFSVVPAGAYMRPHNQRRENMLHAVDFLNRSVPRGSLIFTDFEGGLLLSYYFCHSKVVQLEPPIQPFLQSRCSQDQVISLDPRLWVFRAQSFRAQLEGAQQKYGLGSGTKLWVFQAGFIVDREPDLRAELRRLGCVSPQAFGENILLCELTLN